MAFPTDPLGVTVELFINSSWVGVTSLIYEREPVAITRGRSSEAARVDPSTCTLVANNRGGRFSPRNPLGPYYGLIGRNTPLRVRLSPASAAYLLDAQEADGAATPDSAGLSIVGDIDIRIDVQRDDWTTTTGGLANKWGTTATPGQSSWAFLVSASQTPSLAWTADGSTLLLASATAAVAVPASGRLALRATLDVNNGSGGRDVRFYTAPSMSGTWTQLGATVTTAGVTSIFNGTAPVEVGRSNAGPGLVGRLYAFQCYQGIAGTLRADLDVDRDAGADSVFNPATGVFTDGTGNVWTLDGGASVADPGVRFVGEVSEWPQRWDASQDVTTPMTASGITRRLSQGQTPLKSALRRAYNALPISGGPRAYWPCEDPEGSTQLASDVAQAAPMRFVVATPQLASNSDFVCSAPLPTVGTSRWVGAVPGYDSGQVQVWFLARIPAGTPDGACIIRLNTTGTLTRWDLLYHTIGGGSFSVNAYGQPGAGTGAITVIGPTSFAVDGDLNLVALQLVQDGADIDWTLETCNIGTDVIGGTGGTVAGQRISRANQVTVNPAHGVDLGETVAGHIAVWSEATIAGPLFTDADMALALRAWVGETAGRRIQRLCAEEAVVFRLTAGDLDATTPMGAQTPAVLLDLLVEAADADQGLLYEPRDLLGLAYRTRESLYNQTARLAADYEAQQLAGMEPVDDDQFTRNDITVRRAAGSSVRAVQEDGPLSVDPPEAGGVGRYDTDVTLNLEADGLLPDAAGWLLHLGTVDEARYPVLGFDLAHRAYTASQTATLAVQDLDVGDRLTVENPPGWLPPDDVSALAQGFTETLGAVTHRIDVNAFPERPWSQPGRYDATTARYTTDGTSLNEALDATETGVDVVSVAGSPLWSVSDGSFQVRVGGEVMTVTAIPSTVGQQQTLTVTRSVNGVVKTHASGAEVRLEVERVYAP